MRDCVCYPICVSGGRSLGNGMGAMMVYVVGIESKYRKKK